MVWAEGVWAEDVWADNVWYGMGEEAVTEAPGFEDIFPNRTGGQPRILGSRFLKFRRT